MKIFLHNLHLFAPPEVYQVNQLKQELCTREIKMHVVQMNKTEQTIAATVVAQVEEEVAVVIQAVASL